jgi:hypothetical protein
MQINDRSNDKKVIKYSENTEKNKQKERKFLKGKKPLSVTCISDRSKPFRLTVTKVNKILKE